MKNKVGLYDLIINPKTEKVELKRIKDTGLDLNTEYAYSEVIDSLNETESINFLRNEHSYVVAYNNISEVTGIGLLGVGTDSSGFCNPKTIGSFILLMETDQFIVIHTHPAGSYKPSSSDIATTKQISKMAEILEIPFLDHLVVSKRGWYGICSKHEHKN